MTLFMVTKRITNKGNYAGYVCAIKPGDWNDFDLPQNFAVNQTTDSPTYMLIQRNHGGTFTITPHPGDNVPYIWETKFDGVNCANWLTSSGTSLSSSGASSGSFNCSNTVLAARWYSMGLNSYNNINIGEVLIYNSALSDSERLEVESYLAAKWGITPP
jgi:hypothetical protein